MTQVLMQFNSLNGLECISNTISGEELLKINTVDIEANLYGYVLNDSCLDKLKEILTGTNDIQAALIAFVDQAKGSYWGWVNDKRTNEVFMFIDNNSSKQVFYSVCKGSLFFGTSLKEIGKEVNASLDEFSAYCMLTYGGMLSNKTFLNDVFKLQAGECLKYSNENLHLVSDAGYNKVSYRNRSKAAIVSDVEELWRTNVTLEYSYDAKRSKKHLTTLSGGLDSRTVLLTAFDEGFTNNTNLCFSQKNYLDETIAQNISKRLGQEFKFFDLSGGVYLLDVEYNTKINQGLVFYSGCAHMNAALDSVSLDGFGLLHTGLLGDGLLGGFSSSKNVEKATSSAAQLSSRYYSKIEGTANIIASKYANEETYKLYNRGLNVAVCSSWLADEKGVPLSAAFMHKDFMSLCLSIPPELKYNQDIYLDWINKYHKNATKDRWERTKMRPNAKWKTEFGRYLEHAVKYGGYVFPKLKSFHMNPYDVWLKNDDLRSGLEANFLQSIEKISVSPELDQDLRAMYASGTAMEKVLCLSVTNAITYLFDE